MLVVDSIQTEIKKICLAKFGEADLIVRSPGRINLIGEHTDYNLGFVLPAAIDKAIYVAIRKRADQCIQLYAANLDQFFMGEIDSLEPTNLHWPNYILGVVAQIKKTGCPIFGFDAVVMGDVPLGAGLSSSAAVECATAFALNELMHLGFTQIEMVLLVQKAENEFVGVQCGIMDPFASMFGKNGQVIRLDCRSHEYNYMPFAYPDISVVLFDTGLKHSLASSEYNLRRQECESGVALIQKKYPAIPSLRDANLEMVNECLLGGNPIVYNRCKFIVEEIQRVQDACMDLVNHDLSAFGKKMFATHEGLSSLYQVSCVEADALVSLVKDNTSVYGARMMGGGFGGCTINIVKKENITELIQAVTLAYEAQFGRALKNYQVSIAEGTSVVS